MTKFAGRGLLVYREFSLIGQLLSIGSIGSTRRLKDHTRYGEDRYRWEVGMLEGGEVELAVASDPVDVSRDALYADQVAGNPVEFEVLHTTAGVFITFPALVLAVREGAPLDGLFRLSARLKILAPGITFREGPETERAVALSATAAITAAGLRLGAGTYSAAVLLDGTAAIAVIGAAAAAGVHNGAVALNAQAAIQVTAGGVGGDAYSDVYGAPLPEASGAVLLSATAAIAAARQIIGARIVGLSATANIATVGSPGEVADAYSDTYGSGAESVDPDLYGDVYGAGGGAQITFAYIATIEVGAGLHVVVRSAALGASADISTIGTGPGVTVELSEWGEWVGASVTEKGHHRFGTVSETGESI